jgi:LPS sulfotransferase NodH
MGSTIAHPLLAYLVCATPRSGSTLLCELLTSTGVAGRPAEYFEELRATSLPRQAREYFSGFDDPVVDHLPKLISGTPERPEDFEARFDRVLREGTTPNGVFAAKLMWGYLPDFAARIKRLPGHERRGTAEAIAALLPGVRYVRVVRRDKVAQAVSLWRAVQTQRWREDLEGVVAADEAIYHEGAVGHLVEQLTAQEQAWQQWFRAASIEPVVVVYEELAADPVGVVTRVLDELGLHADGEVQVPEPPMRRQSDERSGDWIRRFNEARMLPA